MWKRQTGTVEPDEKSIYFDSCRACERAACLGPDWYEETFPWPGPSGSFPVSTVGWANAIPNNPNRLYQLSGSDGAVYAYQANGDVPITTAFYTTTALDSGATGMAFPSINPAAYSGLTFSMDIQPVL